MKGFYEKKQPMPKNTYTWDVNIVLNMLHSWVPHDKLTLKELTLKLTMLLALLLGQRCQTIHALDIANMTKLKDKYIFHINKVLKHSRLGSHQQPLERLEQMRC